MRRGPDNPWLVVIDLLLFGLVLVGVLGGLASVFLGRPA
jgi:hypothetical protein